MNKILNERGFSLIEVIISIAILGILIIPLFGLMFNNSKLSLESRKQIIATNLAESKIEDLKFSKSIRVGESVSYEEPYEIDSFVEVIKETSEKNKLYKITVIVKRNDEIIEKLMTYRNSLGRGN